MAKQSTETFLSMNDRRNPVETDMSAAAPGAAEEEAVTTGESAPEEAVPENPEPAHVDLSTGQGGCYQMIDGQRIRVNE